MNTDIIDIFRHIVGNHVANAAQYHNGCSDRTPADIRKIQRSVLGNLEEQIIKRGISECGVLEVLRALRESDWADRQSYLSFRNLYDDYVRPVEEEAQRERDRIFGKR